MSKEFLWSGYRVARQIATLLRHVPGLELEKAAVKEMQRLTRLLRLPRRNPRFGITEIM